MNLKEFVLTSKVAFRKWRGHNMTLRAAALTFFIILPLPSLLLIATTVLAQVYGEPQALQQLIHQITTFAGPVVADLVRQLLESSRTPFTSVFASVTSVGFSIAGAFGAFVVLHDTMNIVWEVPQPKRDFITELRQKIVPFLLMSGLGVAIITWTGITTILFNIVNLTLELSENLIMSLFLEVIHIVLSFVLAVFLFTVIYKQLPDTAVRWKDIRLAAIMTGLAFTIANYVFDVYIQTFAVTSIAGAAGALMILLLWIFLMNQLLLFGAEFSKAHASLIDLSSN